MAKKNNDKTKKIILIVILILLASLIVLVVVWQNSKNSDSPVSVEKADIEYNQEKENQRLKDLSGKTEQERMQIYCSEFFKLIHSGDYEGAYKLLYNKYQENYFPTLKNFEVYFEDYFPTDFSLSYENIERLGDIYVLTINVNDLLEGPSGKNFSLYFVIQEKALNNYVVSFSRNSAVGEEE